MSNLLSFLSSYSAVKLGLNKTIFITHKFVITLNYLHPTLSHTLLVVFKICEHQRAFLLINIDFSLAHLSSPVARFRPESVRARKTRLDKIRTSEQSLVKLSSCFYVCRLKAFPPAFLE